MTDNKVLSCTTANDATTNDPEQTVLLTRRLSAAMEEISQSVIICDADDRIVFCNQLYRDHNKAVIKYLEPGTHYETFLRAATGAGLMAHADGREEEWLQQRLEQHRNPPNSFEVQRPGNIWLLVNEQRLVDGGIMILGTDITDLKNSQEKLRNAGDDLERQIAVRTQELTAEIALRKETEIELLSAKNRAEQASLAKSEFLAAMSHELRTPLTSSLGGLGLLRSLYSGELSEQGQELLEMAIRNNEALKRLVTELLDYEKFLSGRLIIETSKHDLCALITKVLEDIRGFSQIHSLSFIFKEPESPVFAEVDEHRFEQVLNNLLSNAAKFSEPGNDVNITVGAKYGRVLVSVRDKGSGIPEEFRKNIFEHFTQADASTTRQHGGTGLGLAITKALTEAMDGTIEFETEVGVGSTFYISLPASN